MARSPECQHPSYFGESLRFVAASQIYLLASPVLFMSGKVGPRLIISSLGSCRTVVPERSLWCSAPTGMDGRWESRGRLQINKSQKGRTGRPRTAPTDVNAKSLFLNCVDIGAPLRDERAVCSHVFADGA